MADPFATTIKDITERPFKVIVLGEANVGKTSLVERFVNQTFPSEIAPLPPTIHVETQERSVALPSGERVRLQVWDTAGQERVAPLSQAYLRNADAVLFIYDCGNSSTLMSAHRYATETPIDKGTIRALVGAKQDVPGAERTEESARRVACELDVDSNDRCSALTGDNVNEIFERLAAKLLYSDMVRAASRHFDHNDSIAVKLAGIKLDGSSCSR